MKGSLIILSFFVLGIGLAFVGFVPEWLVHPDLSMWALYLLMMIVGIGVGSDSAMADIFKRINPGIIMVPVIVIIGSLGGTALFSLFMHKITAGEAMAVGAGFGYYSLSAVIIAQIRGEELGVVALMANIIREVATLVLAPFLVKYFGNLSIIAAGGATAMDTTLPVVVKFSGKDLAVMSLFSGIVLSLLVPVLVPFLLTIFK